MEHSFRGIIPKKILKFSTYMFLNENGVDFLPLGEMTCVMSHARFSFLYMLLDLILGKPTSSRILFARSRMARVSASLE